jgi:hypothetical protein
MTSHAPALENRRQEPRRRTLLGAKIILHGGNSVLDAVVRDISSRGARLRLDGTLGVPNEFPLRINGEAHPRLVTVKWRLHNEMGVSFEG